MAGKRSITRQSLPDVIASDLRERILSGELAEGETIRQEALADEYDVSRMPIREALKRLDAEGLVLLTNNRGASVVKHSLKEIGEIFDLRILLEVDLFRRAIPKMREVDFECCQKLLGAMDASFEADDVGQWGALNYDFHAALYQAAGRRLSNNMLQRLNLQSDRYVRIHLNLMHQKEKAKEEHAHLLELAQMGHVEEGCTLLTHHLTRTKEQLLNYIASRRAAEPK